jgi:signal transduction histidine kinase
MIAHEVRGPLAAIVASAEALGGNEKLDGHMAALASATIVSEATRLERMVRNLLDFTRKDEPPNCAPIDLRFAVEYALREVAATAAQKHVRIVSSHRGAVPSAMADFDQIVQVLANLFQNAIEASPQGGLVQVLIFKAGSAGSPLAAIRISDEGPGIAPEMRGRLFRPFSTTKRRGFGLGLAIAWRIVRAHNGMLRVRPQRHGEPIKSGAQFEILLPAASENQSTDAPAANPARR